MGDFVDNADLVGTGEPQTHDSLLVRQQDDRPRVAGTHELAADDDLVHIQGGPEPRVGNVDDAVDCRHWPGGDSRGATALDDLVP